MCVLSKFKYIQIVLIADTYCLFFVIQLEVMKILLIHFMMAVEDMAFVMTYRCTVVYCICFKFY